MNLTLLPAAFVVFVLGIGSVVAQTVIANPSVKITEIKKADLRDIFLGASSNLPDGSHATPVTLKTGPVHDSFLKAYIGKSDLAFRTGWRALLFAGQAILPQSFDEETALVDYVARVPGAIGYVGSSTKHDKVKVLTVK